MKLFVKKYLHWAVKKLVDVENNVAAIGPKIAAIFFDANKIVWVGGYRIDARVKIDTSTKKILHIRIKYYKEQSLI